MTASRGPATISALICPQGHPSPPDRAQCRVCGAPLSGPVRATPRPPLGRLDLSSGGTIRLDRAVVIGRRPRATRVSGDGVPQLVTVASPQQDISRSHLEIRLEGWHVLAVDLATTNGSRLMRAQQDPVRLRAQEGVVLVDGDVIDLGDGVAVRFSELP